MRWREILDEKWDKTVNVGRGSVDVHRNPSRAEFMKLYKRDEAGRLTLCKNGDILVFTAEVVHYDIEGSYSGEAYPSDDFPTAFCWPGHISLHHILTFPEPVARNAIELYKNNANIKQMLGNNFKLMGEDFEMQTLPIDTIMNDWTRYQQEYFKEYGMPMVD